MMNPEFGSISEGTLRESDLVLTFADYLADFLNDDDWRAWKNAHMADVPAQVWNDSSHEYWSSEDAGWLLEELYDALDECCADIPYMHFGADDGDPACFGFWFSSQSFEEDCQCGITLKAADLSPKAILTALAEHKHATAEDVQYLAILTDHGNLTLYDLDGEEIYGCC